MHYADLVLSIVGLV